MSIASEISRIRQNVEDSLMAVEDKGVTVPEGSTSDDLPELIARIQNGTIVVDDTPDEHGGIIRTITTMQGVVMTQGKSGIIPTDGSQTIVPDDGYTALTSVQIDPIPPEHIGPGVTRKAAATYTPGTTSQTIAAGQYLDGAQTIAAIPTNYIGIGITRKAAATYIPGDNEQVISAGQYLAGDQTIAAIPSDYVGTDAVRRYSEDMVVNGATVTAPPGYYTQEATATIESGTARVPSTTITANPTISVSSSGLITANTSASALVEPTITAGYISNGEAGTVAVSGSKTMQLNTLEATTYIPSETAQTIAAGTYLTGAQTIAAISNTYVGSGVARRTSSNLTASGATVTVPAGYYAEQATKSVDTMTLPTSVASSATTGYAEKTTVSRSSSAQYINIPPGYNSAGGYYTIAATPMGSATAPASISGTDATVSTGANTLTLTKTVSVTPSVTAGYISGGTAGNSSVSLTADVPTQAAATITPGTSDQTIASGTYLTGAQTIKGDSNLVAANIASGVSIFGIQGTHSGGSVSITDEPNATGITCVITTGSTSSETWETLYEAATQYYPESNGNYPYCWISELSSIEITIGSTWRITFDNVPYRCVAAVGTVGSNAETHIIIGNPKWGGGEDDGSDAPFSLYNSGYGAWSGSANASNEVQTAHGLKVERLVTT